MFGQSVVNVETDCIGETNQIVGYVEGEPYIGPYHIHPDTGVKMVGKKHSSSPHSIIYDTRAESLSRTVRRMNSRPTPSNISTTTSGSTPTPTPTIQLRHQPKQPHLLRHLHPLRLILPHLQDTDKYR